MTQLVKIEFIQLPDVRIIGCEVTHNGCKNPVPALWKQMRRDGTIDMLRKLPLAISGCTIGWMGDAKNNTFKYIAGVIAVRDTPVPEGMQYRDLPACDVAKAYVTGYRNAHNLTVDGIKAHNYMPDYSFGWSAEVYPDDLDFENNQAIINYFCPYKKQLSL